MPAPSRFAILFTMIYRIREKFWSFGDSFAITDADGAPAYFVKGRAFSWGDQLSFRDPAGNELAFIRQRLLTFMPRYTIVVNGAPFAEVVKQWSWFRKSFTLDVPGPNDYTITGSFWEHEFVFERKGVPVAVATKKLFAWTDSYAVEIEDGEDDVSILCACIVIDQVLHDERHAAAM